MPRRSRRTKENAIGQYTRREFLKLSVAGAAAATLAGCSLLRGPALVQRDDGALPRRRLGRTDQHVTILGMGGAWLTINAKGNKATPAESRAIIEAVLEGGVRYFDTSPDYKFSEERLGPALAGVRDRVFLTTKTNYADRGQIEGELANSLKLLKTDHVDLLFLHCVGLTRETRDPQAVLGKGGALETLLAIKRRGQTQFIGMSIHLPPLAGPSPENNATTTGLTLLESSDQWDVVMPWVNYISHATMDPEGRIVAPAHKRDIGVVAMKVLGGDGQLADDYDRALGYSLSVPGVACAIIGVSTVDQVRRAVRAAREYRPLSDAQMHETIEIGKHLAATRSPKAMLLEKHAAGDFGATAGVVKPVARASRP